jgi:hypothetical protein
MSTKTIYSGGGGAGGEIISNAVSNTINNTDIISITVGKGGPGGAIAIIGEPGATGGYSRCITPLYSYTAIGGNPGSAGSNLGLGGTGHGPLFGEGKGGNGYIYRPTGISSEGTSGINSTLQSISDRGYGGGGGGAGFEKGGSGAAYGAGGKYNNESITDGGIGIGYGAGGGGAAMKRIGRFGGDGAPGIVIITFTY